jgi:hypothetical protein
MDDLVFSASGEYANDHQLPRWQLSENPKDMEGLDFSSTAMKLSDRIALQLRMWSVPMDTVGLGILPIVTPLSCRDEPQRK